MTVEKDSEERDITRKNIWLTAGKVLAAAAIWIVTPGGTLVLIAILLGKKIADKRKANERTKNK